MKEAVVFILDTSNSMAGELGDASDNQERKGFSHELQPEAKNFVVDQSVAEEACPGDSVDSQNNTPRWSNTHESSAVNLSKLSCAKNIIENMMFDLAYSSKTNEAGIILLKQSSDVESRTDSHSENTENGQQQLHEIYPNISEMGQNVSLTCKIGKPVLATWANLNDVQCAHKEEISGNFMDGLLVAVNSMYVHTKKRNYSKRTIVLLTDASHELNPLSMDKECLNAMMCGMKCLECSLVVIGFHFSLEGVRTNHNYLANISSSSSKATISEIKLHARIIKYENEKLLSSLAKQTYGRVIAISNTHQLREYINTLSQQKVVTKRSIMTKMELHVAPGISVPVKSSLLSQKVKIPTLKREAILLEPFKAITVQDTDLQKEDNSEPSHNLKNIIHVNKRVLQPMVDGSGEIMTTNIKNVVSYWDMDNPDIEVGIDTRTKAFWYGSDLIPIGDFDIEGLKNRSPACITILGYVPKYSIPLRVLMGPSRLISVDEDDSKMCSISANDKPGRHEGREKCSKEECVCPTSSSFMISALVKAMHKLDQIAICTFVGKTDSEMLMGILAPLYLDRDVKDSIDENEKACRQNVTYNDASLRHLVYVRMAFADDVRVVLPPKFEKKICSTTHDEDVQCDNLVDSLMLPDDVLKPGLVPNPTINCFKKTLLAKVKNSYSKTRLPISSSEIETTRNVFGVGILSHDGREVDDPISTPTSVLESAQEHLNQFRKSFPLEFWNEFEEEITKGSNEQNQAYQSKLTTRKKKKRYFNEI